MTKKTKSVGLIFTVLGLLSTIFGFYLTIANKPASQTGDIIQGILWVAVAIESIFYFGKGGRKEDSRFFKAFAWTFMVGFVFNMLLMVINPGKLQLANDTLQVTGAGIGIIFILWVITYSCFLLLAYSKNLGIKKTANLSYVAVVNTLIILFIQLTLLGANAALLDDGLTRLFMIIVFSTIFQAKYEDKEARGTD